MKLKTTTVLFFIFIYGLFFYLNTQNKNTRVALALDKQIKNIETHYAVTKDYFITDAKSIKSSVINDKKILHILSKAKNLCGL